MIEHTESAFCYVNSSLMRQNFMSIENSQSYSTNELVPDRTKETARKKLKDSLTSKKQSTTKETVSDICLMALTC